MERVSRQHKSRDDKIWHNWLNETDWGDILNTHCTYNEDIKQLLLNCAPFTVTDQRALFDLFQTIEHVVDNNILGDFVECGVYMGGSSKLMIDTLAYKNASRPVWMYDTYEGVPVPEAHELNVDMSNLKQWYMDNKHTDEGSNWCYTHLEHVKANIGNTNNVNFVKGLVEDTIPNVMPDEIAVLRIDVDLATPTRHILDHMYERVVPGGHVIFDDYGYFPETAKTIDDFFKGTKYLHKVNHTVRHIIK